MKVVLDNVNSIVSNSYKARNIVEYNKSKLPNDSVEISSEAIKMMEDNSSLRLEKVENVKSLINNGDYRINISDVALKIMNSIKLYNMFNSEKE